MIVLNVFYKTKPGQRTAFYKALHDIKAPQKTRKEKGNIRYDYFISIDNEDEMVLIENWESEEALKNHMEASHFKELARMEKDYLEDVKLKIYSETEGK